MREAKVCPGRQYLDDYDEEREHTYEVRCLARGIMVLVRPQVIVNYFLMNPVFSSRLVCFMTWFPSLTALLFSRIS